MTNLRLSNRVGGVGAVFAPHNREIGSSYIVGALLIFPHMLPGWRCDRMLTIIPIYTHTASVTANMKATLELGTSNHTVRCWCELVSMSDINRYLYTVRVLRRHHGTKWAV
jgi:hypothetical protein